MLLRNYTGKNVRVAVIDSGVDGSLLRKESGIQHYQVKEGSVEWISHGTDYGSHGTGCAEIIASIAPDVEIFDLCIANPQKTDNMSNLLTAIEWAASHSVDVINLSLGYLTEPDEALRQLCKRVKSKGIVIVAAGYSPGVITYPADYGDVVRVDASQEADSGTIIWNGKSFIVSYGHKIKDLAVRDGSSLSTTYMGPSYGCSRIAGILCLTVEATPLSTSDEREDFLKSLIDCSNGGQLLSDKKEGIASLGLPTDTTIVVPMFDEIELIRKYCKMLYKPIKGVYDNEKGAMFDFSGDIFEHSEYTSVILANGSHIRADGRCLQHYQNKEKVVHSLGRFDDDNPLLSVIPPVKLANHGNKGYITELSVPTIGILGTGVNRDKFKTHLSLVEQFQHKGYKAHHVCSNPLGKLFNMYWIDHWDRLSFPDVVYEINSWLRRTFADKEIDVLVCSVGGGVLPMDGRTYCNTFGASALGFLSSFLFDTYILNIDVSDSPEYVDRTVKYINTICGIYPAAVVLGDTTMDLSTFGRPEGFLSRPVTDHEYDKAVSVLSDILKAPVLGGKANKDLSAILIRVLS